jgi:general secretion pathway protein C
LAMFRAGKAGRDWWQHWPRALLALLVLLLIAQIVRLVWAITVPVGPLGDWRAGVAQSIPPTERRALFAAFDPFFRSNSDTSGAGAVTALDLTLFGVNLNEASGGGSAILAGADGVQSSFAVGDEVMPGVKLAGVAFDHVLLDRGGVRESLFLDQSTPAANAATDVPSAPLAVPTATPATTASGELSPQALQAGIGLAARSEGGKVTGLTVQPQGDGAVFRSAGLRPGDVIRSVNGRPVGAAADLAGQIAPGARLSLEVERGSTIVPVAIFVGKP